MIRRFRAGERITAPMMFVDRGGDPLVIAGNDDAPEHPAWFVDPQMDPHVTVETPDGAVRCGIAEEVVGDGRAEARAALIAAFPLFVDHQARAGDRTTPLVRLRSVG